MGSGIIKKDMETFQASVKTLGDDIKKAASLWGDEKYKELSASVSSVAKQSRDLILAGERCCTAIDRFSAIASEEY